MADRLQSVPHFLNRGSYFRSPYQINFVRQPCIRFAIVWNVLMFFLLDLTATGIPMQLFIDCESNRRWKLQWDFVLTCSTFRRRVARKSFHSVCTQRQSAWSRFTIPSLPDPTAKWENEEKVWCLHGTPARPEQNTRIVVQGKSLTLKEKNSYGMCFGNPSYINN